jgi:hypothetical protein
MHVFEWFHCFKHGHTSLESNKSYGCHSWSRNDDVIAKVHDLVRADRRLSFREVTEEQGISFGSCQAI